MVSQIAHMLKGSGSENPLFPDYPVERIFHAGQSQQGGSIVTYATAFHFADEVDQGGVNINETCWWRVDFQPYGGMKNSGIGREGIKYAIEEMTEWKTVTFNLT